LPPRVVPGDGVFGILVLHVQDKNDDGTRINRDSHRLGYETDPFHLGNHEAQGVGSARGGEYVVDNIDGRILKLEKECPTDWGPEKIELEKRIRDLESKCDMIWADLSPDDLE
jgi:hypothetical protein